MNTKQTLPQRAAFTLVEILVVVAILAILAALLFPAISRIRERTASTKCVANQRQIGVALHLYANDHNGRFPPFYSGGRLNSTGTQRSLPETLVPPKSDYLPDNRIFLDPGGLDRIFTRNPQSGWADWKTGSVKRSGYWHVYMSPTADYNPERADADQYGANDTVLCPPYKVMMYCYYHPYELDECAHPDGSVNVLRLGGDIQHFTRAQYQPTKGIKDNFGNVKTQ